jgi:Kef-type K+ transport system membrane component KefB
MRKLSYKLLLAVIAILAAVGMLLPTSQGYSDENQEKPPVDKGHVIVVEKIRTEEDGSRYLMYLSHKYHIQENTNIHPEVQDDIKVGSWLRVEYDKEGTAYLLKEIMPYEYEHRIISGTIGSLLYDEENNVVGFVVDNSNFFFKEEDIGHLHHKPEVGMGVKVYSEPMESTADFRVDHFDVLRHHTLLHSMTLLMMQIAIILLVAKVFGELFERFMKQPAVLGELLGGIIISPFALGRYIDLPGLGPLFQTYNLSAIMKASPLQPDFAVSPELWAIAQIAAIILLFMAGLETDLSRFLRYAGPATVIGIGGVVFPFALGALATVWFVPGLGWADPAPLFMGAIMVATSVGITARVLSDINRLDTSEGVTILAGAVIDDVLGILVLAIVNAIALAELAGQPIDVGLIGTIAAKAVLFWLGLTGIGILVSRRIEKIINWFRSRGAKFALGLSICFAAAATAELFGLAMIIGAYSIGLALSDLDMAHSLEEKLTGAYNFVVPIFFVVMGMMVDINAMLPLFWPYGVVISIFAVISKVAGCGLPALAVGFNKVGAWRIGIGMMPRGEVALIIAGVGIANGIIGTDMFGVAILLTLVTTLMAPPMLVPAFQRGGVGTVKGEDEEEPAGEDTTPEALLVFEAMSEQHHSLLRSAIVTSMIDHAGFQLLYSNAQKGIFEMDKDGKLVVVREYKDEDDKRLVSIDAVKGTRAVVREAVFQMVEDFAEYREQVMARIVESDPNFARKIKRVTSE